MDRTGLLLIGRMMPMIEEQLEAGFDVLRVTKETPLDSLGEAQRNAIRCIATGGHMRVDGTLMQHFPNLAIVSNFGVGYDTVDAAWAGQHGIYVTNTPDVLTEEVADTALGLLIMTARSLSASERYLRAGNWAAKGAFPLTHTTLRGRHVGIVGLGRIGKAIAKRCEACGLAISYFGRRKQEDVAYPYYGNLVEMARAVDTLMIVVPGGAGTEKLVDAEVLAALGPDGIVVNIARGTVIDEAALIEALEKRVIAAAGLDVFEKEPQVPEALMAVDSAVLLPHVGSASVATRNGMGQLVVDNLIAWRDSGRPITPVAETPIKD